MGDHEKACIVKYLLELFAYLPLRYDVKAYIQTKLLIHKSHPGGQSSHNQVLSPQSPADTTSSEDKEPTMVIPDLCIVKKSDDSEALGDETAAFRGPRTSDQRHPVLVLEVTGINRENDLEIKRDLYEKAGIKEYVVIDRQLYLHRKYRDPCVIVFELDRHNRYFERIYKGDEKVKASFFEHWGLTAKQLLDYKAIRKIYHDDKEEEIYRRMEEEKDEQRARSQLEMAKLRKKLRKQE